MPFAAPWHESRLQHRDFMATRDLGIDEEKVYLLGAWKIVTREILMREELDQRGISYETLPQIFPMLGAPPIVPLPSPSP